MTYAEMYATMTAEERAAHDAAIAELECLYPTCRECPYHDPADPDICSGDLPMEEQPQ